MCFMLGGGVNVGFGAVGVVFVLISGVAMVVVVVMVLMCWWYCWRCCGGAGVLLLLVLLLLLISSVLALVLVFCNVAAVLRPLSISLSPPQRGDGVTCHL